MDPYLRIGPFKIEELNEEPIVLIFHDFLTNVETYEIISRASSKLFISQTGFSRETSKNMHLRLVACKVCKIITNSSFFGHPEIILFCELEDMVLEMLFF